MVFAIHSLSFNTDSDTESEVDIGFCPVYPRTVFAGPSSSASTDSDTESGGMKSKLVLKLDLSSDRAKSKALRLLAGFAGVESVALGRQRWTIELVGSGFDASQMVYELRKKFHTEIVQEPLAAEPKFTLPTSARITELQPNEDTDLERKTSPGMLTSGERDEQSEKQQEGQLPTGQADCYISQVKASLLSHPLPSMSLPLVCETRPSSSPVSPPSEGTSDQKQATPDHLSELSFPFAPSSSRNFSTGSLADMPALSSISGGACLPRAMKLVVENGVQGHDQLCDTAVHHLLSGIDGNGELEKCYELRVGERASHLEGLDDSAAMLCKQVEELESKVSMATITERHLMNRLRISEKSHDNTKSELALTREKLNEANSRIEYLEGAISRYQNRIVVAEIEKEKAEERAFRAGEEGEAMRHLVRALRLQGVLP